ncbi:MAG TPA: hypothetical protein VGE46_07190 [Bdellovibrio sp.]
MKTTLLKVGVFALLLSVVAVQAQAGSYSMKCDDYSAAGFSSKDACLKDGRWHVVYENSNTGAATYGSVDILNGHMAAGADVKVIAVNQQLYLNGSPLGINHNVNEKCQQVYRSNSGSRPIYCLSPVRFGGEDPSTISHGSARYGTDGKVFCNAFKTSSGASNGCTMDPVALKWLVKY